MMISDVRAFLEPAGQLNNEDAVPLYRKLINEEYTEFVEATDSAHKLQEALDVVWVAIGYCLAKGWDVEGAWKELTRANLSKLQFDPSTGTLRRREDGKIMKPEGWIGPDLTPYVNGGNNNKEVAHG